MSLVQTIEAIRVAAAGGETHTFNLREMSALLL